MNRTLKRAGALSLGGLLCLGFFVVASPTVAAEQKCTPGDISPDGYHCECSDPNDGESCNWNDPCPGTQGPNPDGTCPPTGGGGEPCRSLAETLLESLVHTTSATSTSIAATVHQAVAWCGVV